MILRDYQENIINWLRHGWKNHDTHLIQAPTGAGKTIIAGTITKGFYDRGMRVLFTVPRTALINQTVKAFKSFGIDSIGVMQADHEMTDDTKQIQVGTVQTLARRGYGDFDCLIVDEAHIRNIKLIEFMENSDTPTIGLTATPYAHWMGGVYDNFIKRVTMKQLMDLGYLSQYEFFAPTKPSLKGVRTVKSNTYGDDYAEGQIAEIMGDAKIAGDIIQFWLANGQGRPTVAFCCNVLHANFLTVEFRKVGVKAEVMVGSTPKEERQRIFKDFGNGIVHIICSVDVLVEGFDSDVRCIIYAKPTKSETRWVQSIGRGVRTAKGKDKCLVFDHSGTVIKLGMPHEIEYDELFQDGDAMKEAQAAQQKEKSESTSKECSSCNYIKPPGEYICSKCGFKPIYGEDGEVDESIQLKSLSESKYSIEDKKRWYGELCGYWQQKVNHGKNWKKGWINHKYKEKFGDWPDFRFSPTEPGSEVSNYIKHMNIKAAKGRANSKTNIAKLRESLNA